MAGTKQVLARRCHGVGRKWGAQNELMTTNDTPAAEFAFEVFLLDQVGQSQRFVARFLAFPFFPSSDCCRGAPLMVGWPACDDWTSLAGSMESSTEFALGGDVSPDHREHTGEQSTL